MMSHYNAPLDNIVPSIVLEGIENGKEVNRDTSQGKDNSMKSVLFPNYQGAFQNAMGQHVENE
jgi:hypothetical protein